MKNISLNITGYTILSEVYAIADMVVKKNEMIPVRDALKPHRGEIYIE
jgi:hypothetical protein